MKQKLGFEFRQKTVTTAGSPVRLSDEEKPVIALMIIAMESNTGDIYVGNETVSSTKSDVLPPSQNFIFSLNEDSGYYFDLKDWFIDASVDNQKVVIFYVPCPL